MKLSKTRLIYLLSELLIIVLIVLAYLPPLYSRRGWFLFFAVLLLIASSALDYQYWRCPHCGSHLGRHVFKPVKKCSACGHLIDYKNEVLDAAFWREDARNGYKEAIKARKEKKNHGSEEQ